MKTQQLNYKLPATLFIAGMAAIGIVLSPLTDTATAQSTPKKDPYKYEKGKYEYDKGKYDKGKYKYDKGKYEYDKGKYKYEKGKYKYDFKKGK